MVEFEATFGEYIEREKPVPMFMPQGLGAMLVYEHTVDLSLAGKTLPNTTAGASVLWDLGEADSPFSASINKSYVAIYTLEFLPVYSGTSLIANRWMKQAQVMSVAYKQINDYVVAMGRRVRIYQPGYIYGEIASMMGTQKRLISTFNPSTDDVQKSGVFIRNEDAAVIASPTVTFDIVSPAIVFQNGTDQTGMANNAIDRENTVVRLKTEIYETIDDYYDWYLDREKELIDNE